MGRAVTAALTASGSTVVAAARSSANGAANVEPRAIDLVYGDVDALVAGADRDPRPPRRARYTVPRGSR